MTLPGLGPHGASASIDDASSSTAVTWFRILMLIGIVTNVLIALASIAWPLSVLHLVGLEPAQPLVWPRFAAFLLILLSMFYIPAAIDPLRNRFSAIVSVLCRFGGVAFFLIIGGRYIVFGLYDLIFGFPQAILLFLAQRHVRT